MGGLELIPTLTALVARMSRSQATPALAKRPQASYCSYLSINNGRLSRPVWMTLRGRSPGRSQVGAMRIRASSDKG